MVMCLVRATKDATITRPCAGNDLTATGGHAFRIGRPFVNCAAFGGDDRFYASIRQTLAADGSRNGIKQRIEFEMQSHNDFS